MSITVEAGVVNLSPVLGSAAVPRSGTLPPGALGGSGNESTTSSNPYAQHQHGGLVPPSYSPPPVFGSSGPIAPSSQQGSLGSPANSFTVAAGSGANNTTTAPKSANGEKCIWVLDPMTRKLRVPMSMLVPTQATQTMGSVPSLCIAFIEGRCRHSWCRQAHILPSAIAQLRHEALNAPTCCTIHNDPHDTRMLTDRFSTLTINDSPHVDPIPTDRVALTVGLQRYLAHQIPVDAPGPNLEIPSKLVCRLHLQHRCRYLEDCNNVHLCRELDMKLHPPPHLLQPFISLTNATRAITVGDVSYNVTMLASGAIADSEFHTLCDVHAKTTNTTEGGSPMNYGAPVPASDQHSGGPFNASLTSLGPSLAAVQLSQTTPNMGAQSSSTTPVCGGSGGKTGTSPPPPFFYGLGPAAATVPAFGGTTQQQHGGGGGSPIPSMPSFTDSPYVAPPRYNSSNPYENGAGGIPAAANSSSFAGHFPVPASAAVEKSTTNSMSPMGGSTTGTPTLPGAPTQPANSNNAKGALRVYDIRAAHAQVIKERHEAAMQQQHNISNVTNGGTNTSVDSSNSSGGSASGGTGATAEIRF